MIAKIVKKRKKYGGGFENLISYVLRKKEFNIQDFCKNDNNLNNTIQNFNSAIKYEHNCISILTIADEMSATSIENTKINDPVFHLILSWDKSDNPTHEQMFDCAREAIKSLGFIDNQYITVIHDDTDNIHTHSVINKVNRTNFKGPDRSFNKFNYFKLDKLMRELEIKYNFKNNNGPYLVIDSNGKKIVEKKNKKLHVLKKNYFNRYEYYSDNESFYTFINDNVKKDLLSKIKNVNCDWNEINNYLSQYGIKFIEKGQGFILSSFDLKYHVKASTIHEELSKHRVEKRKGKFIEFKFNSEHIQNNGYTALRPLKRDPNERAEKRAQRANARADLKERYVKYKTEFKKIKVCQNSVRSEFKKINAEAKKRRQKVREEIDSSLERKAMYSIIAFESLKAKEQLKHDIAIARKLLRTDPANRPLSYREWVKVEADKLDPAAISQLRGWNYAEKRKINKDLKNNTDTTSEIDNPNIKNTKKRLKNKL